MIHEGTALARQGTEIIVLHPQEGRVSTYNLKERRLAFGLTYYYGSYARYELKLPDEQQMKEDFSLERTAREIIRILL